jgi:hypothetical protein
MRSSWKGKYTPCDYNKLNVLYYVIPISKLNTYIFSCFNNIVFELRDRTVLKELTISFTHLGFTIGSFIFSREMNVVHNKKKMKKQKSNSRFRNKNRGSVLKSGKALKQKKLVRVLRIRFRKFMTN